MRNIFILWALFHISKVRAIETFFRGHMVGYDIPPPDELEPRSDSVITDYFTQKLDHYDPTNTQTWSQRYYVNDEFFDAEKRNVVFLLISGEGEASIRWMTSGAWMETAQMYDALVFQLEHRFYGESHPFVDLSTENLRYLTSPQALGDLSTFITGMNEQYELPEDVKWIVFGGSYAGSLAAWLRMKYPHLVQGVMSASGPLYAQLDFPEYLQVVADDIAKYSQECVDVVKTSINQIEDLLNNPGNDTVTRILNLCTPIEEDLDNPYQMANFFESIAYNFAGVAQYNKNAGRTISLDDLCDILTDQNLGREIFRLAEMNKFLSGTGCLNYKYESTVNYLKNTRITRSGNMRQWIYQTCTEYGWYQTSTQENQVFGNRFPIEFFTQLCIDVYGEGFNESYIDEKNEHINLYFGGYDIDVSNVVFVHGSYDPWHPMGLVETTDPSSPVIFINGTAHCANMYNIDDSDLPELTAARAEINRLIGVWLGRSGSNRQFRVSLYSLFIVLTGLICNSY